MSCLSGWHLWRTHRDAASFCYIVRTCQQLSLLQTSASTSNFKGQTLGLSRENVSWKKTFSICFHRIHIKPRSIFSCSVQDSPHMEQLRSRDHERSSVMDDRNKHNGLMRLSLNGSSFVDAPTLAWSSTSTNNIILIIHVILTWQEIA